MMWVNDTIVLGKAVRCARKSLRITQPQLTLATGVGVRFIIDLEAGKPTIQISLALRVIDELGVHRLRQEDFCQALGHPSDAKYQHEGGPAFNNCFALVQAVTRPSAPAVLQLLDYVLFNTLIGNNDAHAKNFSL